MKIAIAAALAAGTLLLGGCGIAESKEAKLTRIGEQCVGKLTDGGVPDLKAMEMCDCLVDRAENWVEKNPGKDYARDVHERLVKQCVIWS